MAASRTIDENTLELVVRVKEMLSVPGTSVVDVVRSVAQLSTTSNTFADLSWVRAENDGYDSGSNNVPTYRQLRVKGAYAQTDCVGTNEPKAKRFVPIADGYFSAAINNKLLVKRDGQVHWNCRYSIEKLIRNSGGTGDVEIGDGEDWTDRSPSFSPLGRDYRQVRIVSDFDDVKRMLDDIWQKCKSDFFSVLKSDEQLVEGIKTMNEQMKRNVNINVSGSGNQIACSDVSVTQQQATSNGMFSKTHVGDVDSSCHVEGGSLISEILKRPLIVIVIIGVLALLLGFLLWKANNVVVEKDGAKVEVQFTDR